MEMKGLMGGFYRISEWIMRFSVTNLLWLITAFPFFLLSTLILFAQTEDMAVMQSTLILMAIVAPFTLFPSTSAMFSLARKWVIGEEDVPLFKTFFISYKQNYVQSMLGGFIYTLIVVIIVVNYRFYLTQENYFQILSVLFVMFLVVVSISLFNFFCVLSHLHMKTLALIKNSILITVGKPFTSILMIVTNLFIMYICIFHFNLFLAFFFMGSLVAYMTFFHFHRMFLKIQDKQKELEEAEKAAADENSQDSDDEKNPFSKY
jgi:uncharacterized membrane protein YesL